MDGRAERVRDFRDLHGLTQADLAERIGLSQPVISAVEKGRQDPDNLIDRICAEYGIADTFFLRGRRQLLDQATGSIRYRRRSRASAKATTRATALFAELYDAINVLGPIAGLRRSRLEGPYGDAPEEAAEEVRQLMRLHDHEPVPNMIRRVENLGVIVFPLTFGDVAIDDSMVGHDGMSAWDDSWDLPAIGYLPTRKGDRLRLTIGHELGHLVLHRLDGGQVSGPELKQIEKEATEFAGALLLPLPALRAALPPGQRVTLDKLKSLKVGWGISMGALIMRCFTADIIDEDRKTSLWKQMSSMRYRKDEPGHVGLEHPELLSAVVQRALAKSPSSVESLGIVEAQLTAAQATP